MGNHFSLTKFCVAQFKSPGGNKGQQRRIRDLIVASKHYEDEPLKEVVGEWNGEKDFREIEKAVQARSLSGRNVVAVDMPEETTSPLEHTADVNDATPTGTQNPHPPESGAPLMGDSALRTLIPELLPSPDPPTPTHAHPIAAI